MQGLQGGQVQAHGVPKWPRSADNRVGPVLLLAATDSHRYVGASSQNHPVTTYKQYVYVWQARYKQSLGKTGLIWVNNWSEN